MVSPKPRLLAQAAFAALLNLAIRLRRRLISALSTDHGQVRTGHGQAAGEQTWRSIIETSSGLGFWRVQVGVLSHEAVQRLAAGL